MSINSTNRNPFKLTNMKRAIKAIAWCVAVVVILALSLRIERLDERTSAEFDPTEQVEHFWAEELPALLTGDRVVEVEIFCQELKNNRQLLIDRYGLTLGIGAPYSLLLGGEFTVAEVGEELTMLRTEAGATLLMRTAYIFGNTVREATGAFSIDDYENTMDFNSIASELNDRVVECIVAPAEALLRVGSRLRVVGALDLTPKGGEEETFELIPLLIQATE